MPRLVQLVHGYPPREVAGTEVYASRVSASMLRRGWSVEVIAATRSPARAHGSVFTEEVDGVPVHRIVNNLPWRPLGQKEQDPLVERRATTLLERLSPDVVHVQHLLFLSAHLRFSCPTIGTLHDAWAWCARGGTLLRNGDKPCSGPENEACSACYASWSTGTNIEHMLARTAGVLGKVIEPDRLHEIWRTLPGAIRSIPSLGAEPPPADPTEFLARQQAVRDAFLRLDVLLSPSSWLAQQAQAQGLGHIQHLPHGSPPAAKSTQKGPLVFLGSLAPHKGPHLVAKAVEAARKKDPTVPALEIIGPPGEPEYMATLPSEWVHPALPPEAVADKLSTARALVLGSIWPENAPLVVLEARAAGCPVVAPNIGGLPEIIEHERDGLLYPAGDINALEAAISTICSRSWDHVAPPQTLKTHMDALESLYRAQCKLL